MTSRIKLFLLACSFPFSATPVTAQTSRPVSFRDFLARAQIEAVQPIIDYCAKASPDSQADLGQEFGLFKKKINEAITLLDVIPKDQIAGSADEIDRFMADIGKRQLEAVKRADPAMYCPKLVASLRSTSSASLKARIEAAYSQYMEAARAQQALQTKKQ